MSPRPSHELSRDGGLPAVRQRNGDVLVPPREQVVDQGHRHGAVGGVERHLLDGEEGILVRPPVELRLHQEFLRAVLPHGRTLARRLGDEGDGDPLAAAKGDDATEDHPVAVEQGTRLTEIDGHVPFSNSQIIRRLARPYPSRTLRNSVWNLGRGWQSPSPR